MTRAEENRRLIEGFWVDLYRQDFAALGARFDQDGEYTDIVTPADDVARGPAEITARLRLAFDKLSKLFDEPRHLVAGEQRRDDRARRALGVADRRDHGARRGVRARDPRREDHPVVGLLGHERPHRGGAAVVVRACPPRLEIGSFSCGSCGSTAPTTVLHVHLRSAETTGVTFKRGGSETMAERHLEFEFEVGEAERHNVAFHFDQLSGPLRISVDGQAGHPEVRDVQPAAHPALRVLGGLERAARGPDREDPQGDRGRLPGAAVRDLRRRPGDRPLLQRRLRADLRDQPQRQARDQHAPAGAVSRPVQTGGRFSKKAATPSRASAEPIAGRSACSVCSPAQLVVGGDDVVDGGQARLHGDRGVGAELLRQGHGLGERVARLGEDVDEADLVGTCRVDRPAR